jgi:putative transposase
LWVASRRVTKTATVSLEANQYAVDPALVGRRVELRYDPADLGVIEVFCQGRAAGVATPFVIGRHTHRRVPQAARPPAPATGVDYLGLVATAHNAEVVGSISFADVPLFDIEAEEQP